MSKLPSYLHEFWFQFSTFSANLLVYLKEKDSWNLWTLTFNPRYVLISFRTAWTKTWSCLFRDVFVGVAVVVSSNSSSVIHRLTYLQCYHCPLQQNRNRAKYQFIFRSPLDLGKPINNNPTIKLTRGLTPLVVRIRFKPQTSKRHYWKISQARQDE